MELRQTSDRLVNLVDQLAPSIARVEGARRFGITGAVVEKGYVVASSRSLRKEDNLSIAIGDQQADAELVGRDAGTDTALLSYDAKALKAEPVKWRDAADLKVGELGLALARPGHSVRAALGALGLVGDSVRTPGGSTLDRYVELDRDLPRRFSGGLVVDADGTGIGIHTRGALRHSSVIVVGSTLQRTVEQLQKHGHVPRGYLGVGVYPARVPKSLADQIGQTEGIAVVAVEEGGPADKAGIFVGDVILSVNAEEVDSPFSLRAVLAERGGLETDVAVLRGGAAKTLNVKIGQRS